MRSGVASWTTGGGGELISRLQNPVHEIVKPLTQGATRRLDSASTGEKASLLRWHGEPHWRGTFARQHWHGYIGMEKEAVDTISGWIKNPKS